MGVGTCSRRPEATDAFTHFEVACCSNINNLALEIRTSSMEVVIWLHKAGVASSFILGVRQLYRNRSQARAEAGYRMF